MAPRIGELVIAKGWATVPQLEDALQAQKVLKGRLGTNLVEIGALDVDHLAMALSEQRGFPVATLKDFEAVAASTLAFIPAPFAQEFCAFPLRREAGKLLVALASPFDRSQVEPIRSMTGMELVPFIAPEVVLYYFLEQRYGMKRPERFAKWAPSAPMSPSSAPEAGKLDLAKLIAPRPVEAPKIPAPPKPPEPARISQPPQPVALARPVEVVAPPAVAPAPPPQPLAKGADLESQAPRPKNPTIIFGSKPATDLRSPTAEPLRPVEPVRPAEPFSSPAALAAICDAPTAPLSPELMRLAVESAVLVAPLAAPSVPVVETPAVIVAPSEPEMAANAPTVEAPVAPGEGEPLETLSDGDLLEPPPEHPAAVPPPAEPKPARRITREDLPAAVLQEERQVAQEIAEERSKIDHDVTTPGAMTPSAILEGIRNEAAAAEQAKAAQPTSEKPPSEKPAEEPKREAMPDIPPDVTPQPQSSAGSPMEAELAALPGAPQRKEPTLEERRDSRITPRSRPPERRPAAPPPSSKLGLGIGIGLAGGLLLGGAIGAFLYMSKPKPVAPPPPPAIVQECKQPPPPAEPQQVSLASATGLVEHLTLDGEWQPLAAGATLADGEQIRTGEGASVRLRTGSGEVELGEYSRLALRRATTEEHRFRLNAGFATMHYADLPTPFALESRGGKLAAVGKADATVIADGATLAAACRAGSLELVAQGKRLLVTAGKMAASSSDGALPSAPPDAPAKVELALDPPRPSPATRSLFLEGALTGGPALVYVEGSPAPLTLEGRFSVEVKAPAKGPFNAVALDALGNKTSAVFPAPAKGAKKAPPAAVPTSKTAKKPAKKGP